ncbi:MAG: hypothetical protein JXA96_09990 [Sedimentisphaerales bacterium]|nr:hypothetical protein [Sedimentisphaerales bacterium]
MRLRIITVGLFIVFFSSSVYALTGPATAQLDKGQWSISGNYFYSSQDMDKVKVKENDGDIYNLTISDWNMNRYYAQLNYGINDNLQVFGRLGMFDIKAQYKVIGSQSFGGVNFDNDIFYGLGLKYTFAEDETTDWGAAFNINMLNASATEKYNAGTQEMNVDVDCMEYVFVIGPTIDMDSWNLYGGALCSMLSIDHDHKDTQGDKGSGDNETVSIGGYIGAQFDISDNYIMSMELQATDNGWGIGAGIEIPF